MKTTYIAIILVLVVIAAIGYYNIMMPKSSKEQACINSGGTVTTRTCCKSVTDFPNTCLIGACGCSLVDSHDVTVCDCGEGKCWNENTCV